MASLDALRSLRCSSARRRTPLWRAAVRGRFRRCWAASGCRGWHAGHLTAW